MSEQFESPLDKIIREAREQGAFEHLPGKGKPIEWEDESQIPDDQRLANRLLKNNNFTLDWIALGQELDAQYQEIRRALEASRAEYQRGAISATEWQQAVETFRTSIQKLNKRVVGYNIRTPHEQFHRRPYSTNPEDQ